MNLTLADLAELPLVAAVMDQDGEQIAHTPEWRGSAPGSISYPVRSHRLVVAVDRPEQDCRRALELLLDNLSALISETSGAPARRLAMLAASLRVVAGVPRLAAGTAQDVIEHALAGISVRTGLDVRVVEGAAWEVRGPEIAALVLVQLAVNAEHHEQATSVTIDHHEGTFRVIWPGVRAEGGVNTTRQHHRRRGWGLGFARLAADTLGGVVYPPAGGDGGVMVATFELGLRRLALPLAMVRANRVVKATRSWDEETNHNPPSELTAGSRISAAVAAAQRLPAAITTSDGLWARSSGDRTWVAVPPDGITDRARDVLSGIGHERALWESMPEPGRSRVFALASLLGAQLGNPLPRVPAHAWNRRCGDLCSAFGFDGEVPHLTGIGAVDPRIVAYMAGEFGAEFQVMGDQIGLRIRPDRLDDALVHSLRPDRGVVPLT